jgi:signal transduction histidine kinase
MKFRFQYIYALFILSFGILTALSVLFYDKLMDFTRSSDEVERNYETMFLLSEVDSYVQEAINSENAFILTRDSSTLTPFFDNQPIINQLTDTLRVLVTAPASPQSATQPVNLIKLKRMVNELMLDARTTINKVATRAGPQEIHYRILQQKVAMNDYKQLRHQMQAVEARTRAERNSENERDRRNTPHFLYATFIFAAGCLIVSFFFIIRELKKRLEFQLRLQQQVAVLNRANTELEQLNHIASHHLQEPLRKIQTFSNRIATRYKELPEEVNNLLEKIDTSAKHMHGLTRDMVKYSNLINTQDTPMFIDLNHVLLKVAEQIDEKLTLKQGKLVITNTLPVIKGFPSQLMILFEQLIDNSIKFSRKDVPPVITITLEQVTGNKISNKIMSVLGGTMYYQVSITDNGMGFDNKYVDKMFYLFQKLEAQTSYQSKGIGLPMVQRIMVNHGGNVAATGTAGEGAIFRLYFPIPDY